jgi:AcrR family transcriptional regulator
MARYRPGIETRAKILAATRALLGESGLDGTTLGAICDRAGIRAGSFYNLFGSKEEAVLEVVKEAITAVDPDPAGAGKDTVADLVDAYIRFFTGEPTLARIYVQIAVAGAVTDGDLGRRVLRHHRRRVERFADAIAREDASIDGDEAVARAEAMLAQLHGLSFLWILDADLDFVTHTRRLLGTRSLST